MLTIRTQKLECPRMKLSEQSVLHQASLVGSFIWIKYYNIQGGAPMGSMCRLGEQFWTRVNGVRMVSWNVTHNPKQGVKGERAPLHYSKGGGSQEATIPFSGMLRKKEFPQMAVSEPSPGLSWPYHTHLEPSISACVVSPYHLHLRPAGVSSMATQNWRVSLA